MSRNVQLWLSVHRYNVHGVSSGKIKRMLGTYEHNVTAQSLFAMLPPLDCGQRQALTTAASTSSISAYSQSVNSAADDLYGLESSLSSARTYVATCFASSVVDSSSMSTAASQCVVSSGEGVYSSSGTSNSHCLVTEAVGSSWNNVAAASIYDFFTPPSSSKSACCDGVGTASCTPTEYEFPVPAASSSEVSSCKLVSSGNVPALSPLEVDALVTTDKRRVYEVSTQLDSESDGTSDRLSETMLTSGQLSQSKLSVLVSDRCSRDEASGIVTEHTECVGGPTSSVVDCVDGVTSSASDTDVVCHSTDFEYGLPRTLTTDVLLGRSQPHGIDIQSPADTVSVSQDHPSCSTDTQLSDLATEKSHTMLLMCSTADEVKRSLSAESEAESDVKTGRNSLYDEKSVCNQRDALNSEQIHSCLTADKTVDCLLTQSLNAELADVNHNEKCLECPVHLDSAQADFKNHDESKACSSDQSIDRSRTAEHNIDGDLTTEMASASTDKQLLCEVTADTVVSSCSVTRQPDPRSIESDSLPRDEGKRKNSDTRCYNTIRAAELIYWGQTDADERLLSQNSDAKVRSVTDSVAEQHDEQGVEPKPQRRRLHGCQKKQIASLMESIWAGKEWMAEHDPGWNVTRPSESSSPDIELSCHNTDESSAEQRSVSDECRSNSTQTEPYDFVTLTKVTRNDELVDRTNYAAFIETSPRDISVHDCQVLPDVPLRSVLHKSCSTADETEDSESSSQLQFLESCFPCIGSRDLHELLANCGNDVVVSADLLLEFGYDYNEPQGDDVPDVSSLSTSDTDSCSSDHSVVVKSSSSHTKSSRSPRSRKTALRLYKDSLISKGIELQSRQAQRRCQPSFGANVPAPSLYLTVLLFAFGNLHC